jgi:hypothetical protein
MHGITLEGRPVCPRRRSPSRLAVGRSFDWSPPLERPSVRDVLREEVLMDQICLVLPILPGQAGSAREFQRELDGPRKDEYDTSERRIGINKEVWYVAKTSSGDQLVAYIESADFNKAFSMFVQSRDEFDLWFKERLADATGVDLNDPPELKLPELVSSYEST